MAVSIQNSYSEYLATGSVNETFAITFDYARRAGENVDVQLNGKDVPRGDYDIVATPERATPPNITGYFIRFRRVITLNTRIKISRSTDRTQLFSYISGLNLSSFDIINSFDKLTRVTQEAIALSTTNIGGGGDTADWALLGNPDRIPSGKLENTTDYIETWAVLNSRNRVPLGKIPLLNDFILPWAQFGNTNDIPEAKLQTTKNFIEEWARTDLNVQIPADKFDISSMSGMGLNSGEVFPVDTVLLEAGYLFVLKNDITGFVKGLYCWNGEGWDIIANALAVDPHAADMYLQTQAGQTLLFEDDTPISL